MASLPETRATELGSSIEDWSDWIRACDADAWPRVLPRLASTCCHSPWCLPSSLPQGGIGGYGFVPIVAVGVVVAVVVGGRYCDSGGCAAVVVGGCY
ncbi:hypothetical protein SO802_019826 [Lithocarpus litseifolius]|uniref:Uncharacterized protein n=1 Tax=Lithocarpus litseifolius TaxID=425828 RepID=A0AAW2CQ86_9ROSI